MKFKYLKPVFENNENEWMTSIEVFNYFDKDGYKWSKNAKGLQGHKDIIARDLSQRYKSKLEVDKSSRPQKYRLKNFNSDIKNNKDNYEVIDEISIDLDIDNKPEIQDIMIKTESNEKNLEEAKKEITEDEFQLDVKNLLFEEYNRPLKGNRKDIKKRRNTPRNTDYEKMAKRNKIKGDLGEKAVIIMEENKLKSCGREDLNVQWVSKDKGDGLGYDIESWKKLGKEFVKCFIEVKTTTGDINTPFDISDKEIFVSKELGDKYLIYRLFGIEKVIRKINYYIIEGDVESQFDLEPTSFKAYLKKLT
ncbi:DUF3883 domain-containing protein [Clostridium estertheticum]|uniref:DUF3883 domain-containing protein n=1 Tax=Clostridium estertheticum TaxID=238834 RepID=UPI001C7D367B|nr:DUF3883 domain-containing protein [Clostridium estertheticum]MBX4261309.1 DUF3883 domain-containing protein [Clostridium estertheticum]WLC71654.1 DUF3883 domain-containing protein [Clostridium estertheticum]